MLYKPNFCCQCGDPIERVEWKLWTSRRFCESCETHYHPVDWMPRFISVFAIVGGLFGLGSFLKPPVKSLSLTTDQFTASKTLTVKKEESATNAKIENSALNPNAVSNVKGQKNQPLSTDGSSVTKVPAQQNLQNQPQEPVYFCGAQTKKGAPCSRKVKGEGRCWQHPGLPAILPKEKLRAG